MPPFLNQMVVGVRISREATWLVKRDWLVNHLQTKYFNFVNISLYGVGLKWYNEQSYRLYTLFNYCYLLKTNSWQKGEKTIVLTGVPLKLTFEVSRISKWLQRTSETINYVISYIECKIMQCMLKASHADQTWMYNSNELLIYPSPVFDICHLSPIIARGHGIGKL